MSVQPKSPSSSPSTAFDWQLVEFMVTWLPYGGPRAEDVMPLFGMTPQRAVERFSEIVLAGHKARRSLTQLQRRLVDQAMRADVFTSPGDGRAGHAHAADGSIRWVQHRGVWRACT